MRRPSGLLMLANRNDLQICEDPALFAEQGVRNRVNHQTTSRGLYFPEDKLGRIAVLKTLGDSINPEICMFRSFF
jgi:hypothetical protein